MYACMHACMHVCTCHALLFNMHTYSLPCLFRQCSIWYWCLHTVRKRRHGNIDSARCVWAISENCKGRKNAVKYRPIKTRCGSSMEKTSASPNTRSLRFRASLAASFLNSSNYLYLCMALYAGANADHRQHRGVPRMAKQPAAPTRRARRFLPHDGRPARGPLGLSCHLPFLFSLTLFPRRLPTVFLCRDVPANAHTQSHAEETQRTQLSNVHHRNVHAKGRREHAVSLAHIKTHTHIHHTHTSTHTQSLTHLHPHCIHSHMRRIWQGRAACRHK